MHYIFVLLAITAGTISGKLGDPMTWILIIACVAIAIARLPWWSPLVLSTIATVANVIILFSWWQHIGIGDRWGNHAVSIFIAYTIIAYLAYGIVYFFRWIRWIFRPYEERKKEKAVN